MAALPRSVPALATTTEETRLPPRPPAPATAGGRHGWLRGLGAEAGVGGEAAREARRAEEGWEAREESPVAAARLATEDRWHGRSRRQRRRRAAGRRETCDEAMDVSAESFPFSLTGPSTTNPADGSSCGGTPTNAVWFKFTASTSGGVEVSAHNDSATNGVTPRRFRDGGLQSYGTELACATSGAVDVSAVLGSDCGTTVPHPVPHRRRPVHDGRSGDISITPAPDGALCARSDRSLGAQFPLETVGEFTADPVVAPSCRALGHQRRLVQLPRLERLVRDRCHEQTGTNAYSRLAVFESTECDPYGSELACVTNPAPNASAQVLLTQGKRYLILFATIVRTGKTSVRFDRLIASPRWPQAGQRE